MCKMFEATGKMGAGFYYCRQCSRLQQAKVMQSGAGFYIGTGDDNGPYCRITDYMPTREKAEQIYDLFETLITYTGGAA